MSDLFLKKRTYLKMLIIQYYIHIKYYTIQYKIIFSFFQCLKNNLQKYLKLNFWSFFFLLIEAK